MTLSDPTDLKPLCRKVLPCLAKPESPNGKLKNLLAEPDRGNRGAALQVQSCGEGWTLFNCHICATTFLFQSYLIEMRKYQWLWFAGKQIFLLGGWTILILFIVVPWCKQCLPSASMYWNEGNKLTIATSQCMLNLSGRGFYDAKRGGGK